METLATTRPGIWGAAHVTIDHQAADVVPTDRIKGVLAAKATRAFPRRAGGDDDDGVGRVDDDVALEASPPFLNVGGPGVFPAALWVGCDDQGAIEGGTAGGWGFGAWRRGQRNRGSAGWPTAIGGGEVCREIRVVVQKQPV